MVRKQGVCFPILPCRLSSSLPKARPALISAPSRPMVAKSVPMHVHGPARFSSQVRWCYTPDSCLGGTNYSGYMAEAQCRPGHTGPFCDVCKPEHHKDTFGHCVKCDGSASATAGHGELGGRILGRSQTRVRVLQQGV